MQSKTFHQASPDCEEAQRENIRDSPGVLAWQLESDDHPQHRSDSDHVWIDVAKKSSAPEAGAEPR